VSIGLPARLEQEPAALLGFVYEDFKQAGGRDILVIFRELVCISHILDLALVVVHQLQQHVSRGDEIGIVIIDPLKLCDVTNGADGGAADLADPLGQDIDALFDLLGLIVEKEMVVAEMRSGDVPVEVLGLDLEGKCVGEQRIHRRGRFPHGLFREVGGRVEGRGGRTRFELSDFIAQGLPRLAGDEIKRH
jgi:hypothetical protein